jgi:hypothetical protein
MLIFLYTSSYHKDKRAKPDLPKSDVLLEIRELWIKKKYLNLVFEVLK